MLADAFIYYILFYDVRKKSVFKLNLTLPETKKNDFQSLPQSEDCMLLI